MVVDISGEEEQEEEVGGTTAIDGQGRVSTGAARSDEFAQAL